MEDGQIIWEKKNVFPDLKKHRSESRWLFSKWLDPNKPIIGEYPYYCLKGHGNEADFLGFFQKLVLIGSSQIPYTAF